MTVINENEATSLKKRARLLSTIKVKKRPNYQLSSVPIDKWNVQPKGVSKCAWYVLECVCVCVQSVVVQTWSWISSKERLLDLVWAPVQSFCQGKKTLLRKPFERLDQKVSVQITSDFTGFKVRPIFLANNVLLLNTGYQPKVRPWNQIHFHLKSACSPVLEHLWVYLSVLNSC